MPKTTIRSLAGVRYSKIERRTQAVERLTEKVAENAGAKRAFWQEILDEAQARLDSTLADLGGQR